MLSIIIPAYNEKENLEPLVEEFVKEFSDAEFILVAEGNDGTLEEAERLAKKFKNVVVRAPEGNRSGKWGAIKHGLKFAKGDVLGFVDANRSVPATSLKKLVNNLEGNDCVIASRKVKGAVVAKKQPVLERFGAFGWNMLVRMFFGLDLNDTQCGAKVFRKETLDSVSDSIETTGFAFDAEMLWRIKRNGGKIKEEGIEWKYLPREGRFSSFSLHHWPGMFKDLLKARFGRRKS